MLTSLATACFLLLVLAWIDAHDQSKSRSKTSTESRFQWSNSFVRWLLLLAAITFLVLAWGGERAIAIALMLLTLTGALGLVIRRVYEDQQRPVSIALVSFFVLLGAVQLLRVGA